MAFASSLDQIGPLARTAEDAALLLEVIAGHDPLRFDVGRSARARIHAERSASRWPACGSAWSASIWRRAGRRSRRGRARGGATCMNRWGAKVEEISLPHSQICAWPPTTSSPRAKLEQSGPLRRRPLRLSHRRRRCSPSWPSGRWKAGTPTLDNPLVRLYRRSRAEGFGPEVKRRIMLGTYALSAGYYDAYYLKALESPPADPQDYDQAFEEVRSDRRPGDAQRRPSRSAKSRRSAGDVSGRLVHRQRQPGRRRRHRFPCGLSTPACRSACNCRPRLSRKTGCSAPPTCISRRPIGTTQASAQTACRVAAHDGELHTPSSSGWKSTCNCSRGPSCSAAAAPSSVHAAQHANLPGLHRHARHVAGDERRGLRAGACKTAVALNCQIAPFTKWDRKNYYYPDLPKGYQISQYDLPFSHDGWLEISDPKGRIEPKRIGIIRAHLEEDAGKSMHDELAGQADSRIDLNRAGTPLLEIVSQPDMRSPAEAKAYLDRAQAAAHLSRRVGLQHAGREPARSTPTSICTSTRRRARSPRRSSKIKNMNSFRAVEKAMEYEAERQFEVWQGDRPEAGRRAQANPRLGRRRQRHPRPAAQGRVEPIIATFPIPTWCPSP